VSARTAAWGAVIVYVVVLHALAVFGLANSWRVQQMWYSLVGAPETDAFQDETARLLARMAPPAPGAVLFFGDSHVQSLNVAAVTERGVNLGVGRNTTLAMLQRLRGHKLFEGAEAVVLHVGVNDLGRRPAEEAASYLRRSVIAVPPEARIVVSGAFPVGPAFHGDADEINPKVAAYNAALPNVCGGRPRCVFLDSAALVRDANGRLDRRYDAGDGVHLNAEGYRRWAEALSGALERAR
jgi:lysophospholipase L1-like esterase